VEAIIRENDKRLALLAEPYDPLLGIGSPLERRPLVLSNKVTVQIPVSLFDEPVTKYIVKAGSVAGAARELHDKPEALFNYFQDTRCKHDFEYWAASMVTIQTKADALQKFVLNRAQRKLLRIMEEMRLAGVPIRIILLKARQWGGSTLIQLYIAWIQLFHRKSWNAIVIADVKEKAQHIRAMYERMAAYHPTGVLEGGGGVELKPYAKTQNIREVVGRDCILGVTSVESPEGARAFTW